MAKYTEQFRQNAVKLLLKLNNEGFVEIDGVEIKNVRMLVQELDISSYSIYKWAKEFSSEVDDDDLDDEGDFFDEKDIEVSIVTSGEKKEIFGIRYYSWFARNLGVKGYSSMVLSQLKLSIGLKLIEQSGVVDMNKAIAKLKVNGEGL